MERCKTCKHYGEEDEGRVKICSNEELYQENVEAEHYFNPPGPDFGCTEWEEDK